MKFLNNIDGANRVVQDPNNRFVTDAEKSNWNGKEPGFTKSTGFNKNFGTTEGTVAQGNDSRFTDARTPTAHTHGNITNTGAIGTTASRVIETGASGVLQAKAAGTTSQYLRGDGSWASIPDATTSTNGLMSSVDKTKLDGVAASANNYTHPTTHPYSMITGAPTSLPASGGHALSATHLLGDDTRAVNSAPSVYMSGGARYANRTGGQTEFKTITAINSPPLSGTYVYLQTYTPWSDSTGGYPIQVVYGNGTPCWRVGVSTSEWSAWQNVNDNGNASTVNGYTVASNVPSDAKFTDTVYTHPANHPPSIIVQDPNNRFVTDTEKSTWNAKSNLTLGTTSATAYRGDHGLIAYDHSQAAHAPSNAQANVATNLSYTTATTTGTVVSSTGTNATLPAATTSLAGLMTNADKTKLDGLNNYTHPANHPPSIIVQDTSNRFVTDAEKSAWNGKQNMLVSGTNIQTINNLSILGAGNIDIESGPSKNKRPSIEEDFLTVNLNVFDKMIGAAINSGTASTPAILSTNSNHPGIIAFRDSTTAGGGYRVMTDVAAILVSDGDTFECVFQIKTADPQMRCKIGFSDSLTLYTGPTSDGLWFEIENSVGKGVAMTKGSSTETGTTYTLVIDTWYSIKGTLHAGGTVATFTLLNEAGNTLWMDSVSSNIPTASGNQVGFGVIAVEGTTNASKDLVWIDYLTMYNNKPITR